MADTPTPEQRKRLPLWAREYISNLERRVVIAESDAAIARGEVRTEGAIGFVRNSSSRYFEPRAYQDESLMFPLQSFRVSDGPQQYFAVDYDLSRDTLTVRAIPGGLKIYPRVANVVDIKIAEW